MNYKKLLNYFKLKFHLMKKKILLLFILGIIAVSYSCTKREFTENDAKKAQDEILQKQDSLKFLRDSLNHKSGIIQYSVHVISAGDGAFFGTKGTNGLDSVTVTVSQYGMTITKKTGPSGIAVFSDLRVGTASVSVKRTDYTPVDFIVELMPETNPTILNYYNLVRYAATMIPVFSTKQYFSTVSGRITWETDLTNLAAEPAGGIEVIGTIAADDDLFKKNYLYGPTGVYLGSNTYIGIIKQIAYGSLSFRTTSIAADGSFSLKVPSTADGLPIKLMVSEVATDQKILLYVLNNQQVYGAQTIRTFFGSNITSLVSGTGYTTPSVIPWVPAAYVNFSAPTGAVNYQPKTVASATAILGESGIASVVVNDPGFGYTQPPILVAAKGNGYNSVAAELTPVMTNGKVTGVTITKPGSGYLSTENPLITIKDVPILAASPTPVYSYSIYNYTVSSTTGHNFQSAPSVSVVSTDRGTGATAEAVMNGFINTITLTNAGTNYTKVPDVVIPGPQNPTGTIAAATATMTTYNPLYSVVLNNLFYTSPTYWYETIPTVVITGTGNVGSGATGVCSMRTAGRVERIVISNPGLGYDPVNPPTVTISGGGGTGATAYATVNATTGVVSITLGDKGSGYTSDPTVTISAPPAGGTTALATSVRSYQVNNLILSNGGSGYSTSIVGGVGVPAVSITLNGTAIGAGDATVYVNMMVAAIAVTTAGAGYTSAPTISINSKDQNGSGATATASMLYNIERVKVITEGSGYLNPNNIKVTLLALAGTYASQPTITPVLGKGVLSEVILPYGGGGDGYTASPIVILNAPAGAPDRFARVTALVAGGSVTGFRIDDPGAGYPYSAAYTAIISTKLTGASLTATVYPTSGQIVGLQITNPGEGYTLPPYIEFVYKDVSNQTTPNTFGTGATATANVVDGRIASVTITNPGSGYYRAPDVKIFVPDHTIQARGYCVFDATGAITSVSLIDESGTINASASGYGYISVPEVTFTTSVSGYGKDASAIAVVQNGRVVKVQMVNKGSGYIGRNTPGPANFNNNPTWTTNWVTYTTSAGDGFVVRPINTIPDSYGNMLFMAFAGKTYIKDLYLGTGKRSTDGKDQ